MPRSYTTETIWFRRQSRAKLKQVFIPLQWFGKWINGLPAASNLQLKLLSGPRKILWKTLKLRKLGPGPTKKQDQPLFNPKSSKLINKGKQRSRILVIAAASKIDKLKKALTWQQKSMPSNLGRQKRVIKTQSVRTRIWVILGIINVKTWATILTIVSNFPKN